MLLLHHADEEDCQADEGENRLSHRVKWIVGRKWQDIGTARCDGDEDGAQQDQEEVGGVARWAGEDASFAADPVAASTVTPKHIVGTVSVFSAR